MKKVRGLAGLRQILIISAFFCLSANTLYANNLEEIFAEAIEAVGKKQAIAKIKSIVSFAECSGPEGQYTTEIKSFRKDKTHFKQIFTYKNETSNIFINENISWAETAKFDEFDIVSPFQKLVVNLHEYQKMAFDFQEMFTDFELIGDETFNNKPSVKVSAKNSLGGAILLFFDKETKLFAGYILPIPDSKETVKNVFHMWKKVGKVLLPSVVTATDSAGDWTLNFNEIRLNQADEMALNIPPRVQDLAELLRLHKEHQTAHLTYDAELFVKSFGDNVTQLQRGQVKTQDKAANLKRFKNYFATYKFIEWEDIKPPVIKISKDGTLATVIVEKSVKGTYKNEKGEEEKDHSIFAWLEVWEKEDGKWKIITIASTARYGKDK